MESFQLRETYGVPDQVILLCVCMCVCACVRACVHVHVQYMCACTEVGDSKPD